MANIEDLKLDIEKGKLEAAESIEDVKAWGATIEQTIDEIDLQVADLTRCLEEVETKEKNQKREEEEAILAKKQFFFYLFRNKRIIKHCLHFALDEVLEFGHTVQS